MTKKLHPIEKEINRIRRKIYEETKHMSGEEFNEYIHKSTEDVIKKYGFKVVKSVNDL